MHTSGSCFCGAIEWEADIDPNMVGLCHCRDCQIFSGSAFRLSGGNPSEFKITKGTPKYFMKPADSGKVRRMAFCGDCGTHLASLPPEGEEEGNYISIRLATSKDFAKLKPMAEIFCDSKLAWMPELDGTMRFPQMPE
jgi:hypothetical protein